jgi:hypothetical protein
MACPITLHRAGEMVWASILGIMMARLTRGVRVEPSVLERRPYLACQTGRVSVHAHHIRLMHLMLSIGPS